MLENPSLWIRTNKRGKENAVDGGMYWIPVGCLYIALCRLDPRWVEGKVYAGA
jgi:hypothetical protein